MRLVHAYTDSHVEAISGMAESLVFVHCCGMLQVYWLLIWQSMG